MQATSELLVESLSEALETMAFMSVMPIEEELPKPGAAIVVSMGFRGPTSGQAELAAGEDWLALLAANVMGVDSDDPETQTKRTDAFKELLNTTCGVLLPKAATTPADVFDVTIPESRRLEGTEGWESFVSQEGVTVWNVEGFAVAVRLITEG